MIKKIFKAIKNDIKINYKSYIIFLLVTPWFFIKFDYNVYTPGGLVDLTNRIEVENSYDSKGSFNLTYVTARGGTAPIILLSYIIPSWDLVSLDDSRIDNESENEIIERNKIYLEDTSYDAVIAAFTEANIEYKIKSINLTVTHVFEYAKTNIQTGDVIKSINGISISTYEELGNELKKYGAGDRLKVNILRDKKIIECYAELTIKEENVVIGISIVELKDIETNPKVKYIFKDNESGASRGLLCTLDIYDKIVSYDLTKGDIIAGTGSIDENGKVGAIDGVKYKLAGAVKKRADVFIVPTDNYEEALKLKKENKYKIEIIEADTLHNVIEKLRQRN